MASARLPALITLVGVLALPARAQTTGHSEHPQPAAPPEEPKKPEPSESSHHEHPQPATAPKEPEKSDASEMNMDEHMHAGVLEIPRARWGSGTSWMPDASPMYAVMVPVGERAGFMFHGNLVAGYDAFSSLRGGGQFISVNSFMVMAWQKLGPTELSERVMLSAEPLTVGRRGYPLILQTGETAYGEPLHDRQHPHDLFMELALSYIVPLGDTFAFQLYAAPAGEPALGPVAYPHRVSAMPDPLAPLGHHWQDSTHIAFGVLTAGVFTRHLKLELSWFNGREPDENRWNIDLRVPDSFAGRVSWNPGERWSLQASYGYLKSPEALTPEVTVHRVTASASYNQPFGQSGNLATTFVYGQNVTSEGEVTPSALLEAAWDLDGHHVVYGRVEYVRKSGDDLALDSEFENEVFDVGTLAAGYVYYLGPFAKLAPGVGVRGTLGFVEPALASTYGTQVPVGGMIFVQLRPGPMRSQMHGM